MCLEILHSGHKVFHRRFAIKLSYPGSGLIFIFRSPPERRQSVRRNSQKSLQRDAPGDVFDMGLKPSIFVNDNHGGQFLVLFRPGQTCANIARMPGVGDVFRMKPRVVFRYDFGYGGIVQKLRPQYVKGPSAAPQAG